VIDFAELLEYAVYQIRGMLVWDYIDICANPHLIHF
jgi:hypothetical protein